MSEQPWYSMGMGYEGIAVSSTGHVLVSGLFRRAILCGASKADVSESSQPTEYMNANGKTWTEWTVNWLHHMDVRTSPDTLLMRTNGVTCEGCRTALERIRDGLPS
jgi:hypothetical protein